MACVPGTPCFENTSNAYYPQQCDNGWFAGYPIPTSSIQYNGPNLPNSGVNTGDGMNVAMQKLDNAFDPIELVQTLITVINQNPSLQVMFCTLVNSCIYNITTTTTTSTTVIPTTTTTTTITPTTTTTSTTSSSSTTTTTTTAVPLTTTTTSTSTSTSTSTTSTTTTTVPPTTTTTTTAVPDAFINIANTYDFDPSPNISVDAVRVNGVAAVPVGPNPLPCPAGSASQLSTSQIGTFTIEVDYSNALTPGQRISLTDSAFVTTCQNIVSSSGTLTFTNQVVNANFNSLISVKNLTC